MTRIMPTMMKLMKPVAWTLAVTGGVAAIGILTLYLYGGLPPFISLANRPVSEPTAEEYDVYSSFIDSFFSSRQPFRMDQQIGPGSVMYIEDEAT